MWLDGHDNSNVKRGVCVAIRSELAIDIKNMISLTKDELNILF
jgi:hypothetical protein